VINEITIVTAPLCAAINIQQSSSGKRWRIVITFPDVPEAITQGETIEECISQASDALEEAVVGRIHACEEIPLPSASQAGQYLIPVPAQTAFKAALYEEVRSQGMNKVELAARLGIDEKEVRRL